MGNIKVNKDEIWLKLDPDDAIFSELVANDVRLGVNIPANLDDEVRYRLSLLRDYSNFKSAEARDLEKLTRFLLSRPIRQDFHPSRKEEPSVGHSTEPVTLRSIAYEAVKEQLELSNEANLDDVVASIIAKGYPGLDSRRASVIASVSAVLSALRNAFPDKIEKSWNKPVWRGKTTGRNPHIRVKKAFEMPDYVTMWESYDLYLKTRRKR
jgi:hypothetical protein